MDASQNYTQNQVLGLEQTELESRALIRTASALNAIMENWDERKSELDEALEKIANCGRFWLLPWAKLIVLSQKRSEEAF